MATPASSRFVFAGFAGQRRIRGLVDLVGLYRSRRALARLDEAALQDIGVSRADAEAEAERPLWDVPAHWTRW